jgi:hypothetical protein
MDWLESRRLILGFLADCLTFAGAAILARDAFRRMDELRRKRTDQRFRKRFPQLNLTDDEWDAAVRSTKWNFAGFLLVCLGFLCQILLRCIELK